MWLTIHQIVELGITQQWVQKKIASGEWQSRDSGLRGRNGKAVREVLLASLPEALQVKWVQQNARTQPPREITPEDAAEEVTANPDDELTTALAQYPEPLREAFIAEVNRLNTLIDHFDAISPKSSRNEAGERAFVPAVETLCQEAVCTNPLILAREPQRGKKPSPFTLENWSRLRKKKGLMAFLRARPKAAGAGDGRVASFSPDAVEWVQENWRNFPTQSHLIKRLKKIAKKKKWKVPSDSTLRRKLNEIPVLVRGVVFGTIKDYTSKYKPYVPRSYGDLAALQIVCGDHHVLDVHAWSDTLQELVRLWITVWQDMRTGLIWGYHLDYTPSSHTIACAYANGVRLFGAQPFSRPHDGYLSFAYTDNGKDYKSRNVKGEIVIHKHAASIDGGLQLILTGQKIGIISDAEVEQLLANLYNGREKPVERTFNDLATAIQNEYFRHGWCGRDTKDKPDAWRNLYARHTKAIKRKQPSPFPSETAVRNFVADWVDEYNTTVHTRSTLEGAQIVPLAEFNRLYTTGYEISNEKLALMLLKPVRGAIGKNGVQMLGNTYVHPALSDYKGVKGADGKALQIEARYTDEDYSTVWLILPDGRICEATRLDRSSVLNPNKETHKLVATLIKHEQKLIRDSQILTHSKLRGETVEDRAAALIAMQQPDEIDLPIAVNAEPGAHRPQSTVQKIGRLDARKLRAVSPQPHLTAEQVSRVESDDSIFTVPDGGGISEFDFEE